MIKFRLGENAMDSNQAWRIAAGSVIIGLVPSIRSLIQVFKQRWSDRKARKG